MDHLLDDGRECSADVGLECRTQGVPDGAGVVGHNTSHCAASASESVIACEGRVVGLRGGCGVRLGAARGSRRTIKP